MRTDADLSMHGISRLVAEFMERLDLRPVDKGDTLQAAERLRSFERPALVVWAAEDHVMPPSTDGGSPNSYREGALWR
jgi:pimeloyl-ACP methyl ester carboxylesterase